MTIFQLLSTHTKPETSQNAGKVAEFPGAKAPYITEMKFLNQSSYDPIPIYRVLDNNGDVIDGREEPSIEKEKLVHMYKTMVQLSQMDKVLYESQRQVIKHLFTKLPTSLLTRNYGTYYLDPKHLQIKLILYNFRQGRISFYMTNYGEEGIHIGSAAALSPSDMVFAQYREVGVFLYRGVTVTELINQCYGNHEDPGKGRQMPVHYGSKHHNLVTLSSPLC